MGINGLHEALRPYCRPVHVEAYRGQTLAADGYSWRVVAGGWWLTITRS